MFCHALPAIAAVAVTLTVAVPSVAESQESKSAPLARQLAQLLDAAKLDTVGAADPATGGFVAALYIPGTQFLVVSGKFAAPAIGTERINKKEFRELYMDLQGASVAGSKFFASDVSCDGFTFKSSGDNAADSWEAASKTVSFEGSRKAKMSDDDYSKAYAAADEHYARILTLLLAQAKPKT